MRYILILYTLFLTLPAWAFSPTIDQLLKELDQTLAEGESYMKQKDDRILRLKTALKQELLVEKQYETCFSIIDEYKSYICDSALVYIEQNLKRANQQENLNWLIRAKLQQVFVFSSSGLFIEGIESLNSIPVDNLTEELIVEYYMRKAQLYSNLSTYINNGNLARKYSRTHRAANDSILHYLPEEASIRLYYQYLQARSANKSEEAEAYIQSYVQSLAPGTHEHAMRSYTLSNFYLGRGDEEKGIEYLILAVISDVKDAVKENRALLSLAVWLYEKKDVQRAYNCIQYALNDANFYNARFRYFQLTQALPIITDAYQHNNEQQNSRLKTILIFFCIISSILLITLFLIQKQKRELMKARKGLDENNTYLEEINNRLNILNQELLESDRVKEEYIGHFIDLYSEYVDKLDEYRKMINHKIAAKRFDELSKMTLSNNKVDHVKELNNNFDNAFLNIYPRFVDAFNELLKSEERFDIRKGELNTELRVFALIRLGITDSNKIASFLRCSVQTVYNYRSKIKRKSLAEEEDIEEKIKKIGSTSINI